MERRTKMTIHRTALLALLALAASACRSAPPQLHEDSAPRDEVLQAQARVFVERGEDDRAEQVLTTLIADYPGFLAAYNELSELYLRQGRRADAMDVLRAGLLMQPDDPVLLNNLGVCHLMEKDYELALERFRQASLATPDDARSRANRAAALGMMGRLDEAREVYDDLMQPWNVHYNMAVLCEALGLDERAQEEFARAEKLEARSRW